MLRLGFAKHPEKYLVLFLLMLFNLSAIAQSRRVLVFTKTARYHHESIPAGIQLIKKLGKANHFDVDTTADSTYFKENNLKKYAAVIFLNTSGNVLDTAQKIAFVRYIEAGGGYVGIHCASSTEKDWTWYGQLVGAVFTQHPEPQTGTVITADLQNAASKQWPALWQHKDEWYNFRNIQPGLHVLLKADESTYKGGTNGADHPLAWYHEFDGGRAFYTALGHFADYYNDPQFGAHILAGINYAIGKNVKLNYNKVKTRPHGK